MFELFKGKTKNNDSGNCKENINKQDISEKYLNLRKQVLEYSYKDMNLDLDNNEQPYISVIDIPVSSGVYKNNGFSLILIYGLNTRIYYYAGEYLIDLEKKNGVMKAMQSFFISIPQTFKYMDYTQNINSNFFSPNIENYSVYIKTRDGIYYKEGLTDSREDKFIQMLVNYVLSEINKE